MSFNSDLNKQAQEVTFSRKMTKSSHPQISCNNVLVSRENFKKHLGIDLDKKFNFNHYIKENMTKVMKGIDVIKRLRKMLPWHSFLTTYKSFLQRHLDYGDIINQKSKVYGKQLRLFNTMPLWPLPIP